MADQILKKFPEHGETLAMKGLLFNSLDKKAEAHELVKKGLKKDLKSHICWHVYGLIHKSDHNYEESIKCYKNALKIEKDNLQMLRDLSFLLVHVRNYPEFTETRRTFLGLRKNQKASWVGLVVAHYLQGDLEQSLSVIEAYENTLPEADLGQVDFEHSEFLLFKNSVLMESGKYEEALKQLDNVEHLLFDALVVRETRAELLLKLGRLSEAQEKIDELIAENPERKKYYSWLEQALGLKADDAEGRLKMYDSVSKLFPKAHVPKRLALNVAAGEDFKARIDTYLPEWLRKGAPSLFANVQSLFKDAAKLVTIESLATGYEASLKSSGKLKSSDTEKDSPSTLLWTLHFLAQLYDLKGDTAKALACINEAVAHTPTVVEVVQERARIFKHGGDLQKAMECINQARELDLQDRFINTKCTKYMIRNDHLTEADATISLFTKAEQEVSPLIELQCMWYAIETGRSHLRQKSIGKALKKFHQVEKHFADFFEDQFDFHQFCMRKLTLRAYVRMMKYEDEIRGHKFFFKAACAGIETYLGMLDKPQDSASQAHNSELEGLSEEEQKKALSKLRKAEAKAKATVVEKVDNSKTKTVAKDPKKVDPDPEGASYLKTADPLAEAIKFIGPLLQFHAARIETHQLASEIYIHKRKPLMVLKSLKKARAIDPADPKMHVCAAKFLLSLPGLTLNPVVDAVVKEEVASFFGGKDVATLNKEFIAQHSKSLPHAVAAGQVNALLSQPTAATTALLLVPFTSDASAHIRLEDAVAAHHLLEDSKNAEGAQQLKALGQKRFPFSTYFNGPDVNARFVIQLIRKDDPEEKKE